MMAISYNFVRLPICAKGDDHHRHGQACLPVLIRHLPRAPKGWEWKSGRLGRGWSIYLQRSGGGSTRWHVVGLPSVDTIGNLATLVDAFVAGHRGKIDGLK